MSLRESCGVRARITFPRIRGPCFYGINMTTFTELVGNNHTPEEIAEKIGADSVNYLLYLSMWKLQEW